MTVVTHLAEQLEGATSFLPNLQCPAQAVLDKGVLNTRRLFVADPAVTATLTGRCFPQRGCYSCSPAPRTFGNSACAWEGGREALAGQGEPLTLPSRLQTRGGTLQRPTEAARGAEPAQSWWTLACW